MENNNNEKGTGKKPLKPVKPVKSAKPAQDTSQPKPSQKKKKVTKKVLRQRQLCGLAIIALVILIIFILIAKGCSGGGTEPEPETPTETTTTVSVATTTAAPPPTTTTTVTTTNPLSEQVELSKRSMYISVGETDVSIINSYPENSGEENEVWTSMDSSIAAVDKWGYVTGMSKGETYVILSFDNNPDIKIEIKVSVADSFGSPVTPSEETPEITTVDGGNIVITPENPTTPVYGYTE